MSNWKPAPGYVAVSVIDTPETIGGLTIDVPRAYNSGYVDRIGELGGSYRRMGMHPGMVVWFTKTGFTFEIGGKKLYIISTSDIRAYVHQEKKWLLSKVADRMAVAIATFVLAGLWGLLVRNRHKVGAIASAISRIGGRRG